MERITRVGIAPLFRAPHYIEYKHHSRSCMYLCQTHLPFAISYHTLERICALIESRKTEEVGAWRLDGDDVGHLFPS